MTNPLFAGIGLGLVSAVVFASATTGPLLVRIVLFFIAPLPIALAGLGWGYRTGVIAGLAGTMLVAVVAGPLVGGVFAVSQAAPIVVLTYLALLSRTGPGGAGGQEIVEWYPAGRLVIWSVVLASLLSLASMLLIGGNLDDLRRALGEFIEKTVKSGLPQVPSGTQLGEAEIKSLSDVVLNLLPAASAMSWMASLLFNLWLAGRITVASGQLMRPWPDLAAVEYPPGTGLAFAAALLVSLIGGYAGLAASSLAGALFAAFVLLGLAVVHYITRGISWRPFALWALYATLLFLNMWSGVLIAILGLSEPIVGLRQRYPPQAQPPAGTT